MAWYFSLAPAEYRDPQRAVEYAHRALALEPQNLNFVNTLGIALYQKGELPLAIEALKLSLRGSSQPVFDLYGLALCHQSAGDTRRAAQFAGRAAYLLETHRAEWGRQEHLEAQRLQEDYLRGVKPAAD